MEWKDVDDRIRAALSPFVRHPRVTFAVGAKDAIIYVRGRQVKAEVERALAIAGVEDGVQVVLTGRVRPARG